MGHNTAPNILFITASRIGDAVLSTGLLDDIAQKYPATRVTIACGPLAVSLFEGYPNLARIIPLQKQKHHKHWLALWRQVVGTRWDIVVDLRNSAVSRLIRTNKRYVFGQHIDKAAHKVRQNAAVMGLRDAPSPKLWFSETQMAVAQALIKDHDPILAVGPTANWKAKTWPVERFMDVVHWMTSTDGPMTGASVAVFSAPGEEEDARKLYDTIPENRRIDAIARYDPGTAAAIISQCQFYIGNDSGLMHCAAAAGVKTLGLFGPSYPHIYGPWGDHAAYVSTPETFDELINYPGYTPATAPCLMESLTVSRAIEAVKALHKKT